MGCGHRWVVEITNLATGEVTGVLDPISLGWSVELNGVGAAQVVVPTRMFDPFAVQSHRTGIYISRISGGTATTQAPVPSWGGFVEPVQIVAGGTTTIRATSMEGYLAQPWETGPVEFAGGTDQNRLIATVVNRFLAGGGLAAFSAVWDPSHQTRQRTYQPWDLPNMLQLVQNYTRIIHGPDWVTSHTKTGGRWESVMRFRDNVGSVGGVRLETVRDLAEFTLQIDPGRHSNYVVGLGEGQEEDQLRYVATDGVLPRFKAAPSWLTASRIDTLREHVEGYLEDNREPDARLDVTVPGRSIDPDRVGLGDTITVAAEFGRFAYEGEARVIGVEHSSTPGGETIGYDLIPTGMLSQSLTVTGEVC